MMWTTKRAESGGAEGCEDHKGPKHTHFNPIKVKQLNTLNIIVSLLAHSGTSSPITALKRPRLLQAGLTVIPVRLY